jgi:protein-disulfide isomerase
VKRSLAPLAALTCASVLLLSLAATASARIDSKIFKELPLDAAPLDTAMSPDGQKIFVLTDRKEIWVFTVNGWSSEKIAVDESYDTITAAPGGNVIILGSKERRKIRVLTLDYVQNIDVTGSPILGPADAPVTVVVFTDFQCPYCVQVAPLLKQVQEKLPKDVRVALKHFPLDMHAQALPAALGGVAAQAQGKFWEYHDEIFRKNGQLTKDTVRQVAEKVGLDMAAFDAAMANPSTAAAVERDKKAGAEAGVRGTPTVFVNGRLLPGNFRNIDGMTKYIEGLLKK